MTVYGWLKKVVYISIKYNKLSIAFYIQLDWAICALVLEIFLFVTAGFEESKAVPVGQISKKFEFKNLCPYTCSIAWKRKPSDHST